jgi:hypothetical protein
MADNEFAAAEGEYLDPGYDATTPSGDNLVNDFFQAEKDAWRRWADASGGRHGANADMGTAWIDNSSPSFFANTVYWSRPMSDSDAAEAIANVRSEFSQSSGGGYLLFSAFPTPDLEAYGLHPVGHPPLMVRSPTGYPPPAHHPDGIHLHPVRSRDELRAFDRAVIEGFPIHEMEVSLSGDLVPSALLDDDRWRFYAGYDDDGNPVATSAAFVSDHVTNVNLVSCVPRAREHGFGHALSWAATLSDPDKPALLIASDDAASLYHGMGYLTISRITLWLGSRPS